VVKLLLAAVTTISLCGQVPSTDTKFTAPSFSSLEEWKARRAGLQKQVMSAAGLLPFPERNPLNAQVFGRIAYADYSIEKVYIETLPGFYLAGNLYRPVGKKGPFPGMLAPHGHAQYGRLADDELFSVPSRGINHARQGYVVFAYDMIGYNDTMQLPHVFGTTPREQLWSFGPLGLQTWNSVRALDFLQTLPDVDKEKLLVTGESGGGTQTFMLCAVDDRPKWSAPVNMISLIMQGGSPCENAPSLRVGTNNVEISALMAPKPMLMVSATGDWTRNTLKEEHPAMKKIYDLYDAGSQVETVQIDAPHNYNKASREQVYRFFAKHVLGDSDLSKYSEKRIRQEKLQDMLVFMGRPLPANALDLKGLFAQWISAAEKQNAAEWNVKAMREKLAVALGVAWPAQVATAPGQFKKGKGGAVIAIGTAGPGDGRSELRIDLRPNTPAADMETRYYLTFNRSDDAKRVQDIVTAVAWLRQQGETAITIQAQGKAAVLATFAAAAMEQPVKLDAPLGSFRGTDDEMIANCFVPGLQKAGGIQTALRVLSAR
jgi:dienelactone hydrolase